MAVGNPNSSPATINQQPSSPISSGFEIFLHRARRNWTVWALAEHAALGLLGGCGAVVLLLPILLWRGQPGLTVAMVFPSLGIAVGTMVGFRRRPGLRDVAQLADERFNTADLLATALALRGSSEAWNANILKMADACASGLSPALLTPHHLGPRAWSGIALALAAAMTMGLLSSTTPSNRVEAAPEISPNNAWSNWREANANASETFPAPGNMPREARAEMTPDSQSIHDEGASSQGDQSNARSNQTIRQGQQETGTGGGSARTDSAQIVMPPAHLTQLAGSPSNNGVIASGGRGREARSLPEGGTTGGEVSTGAHAAVAPWSSSDWPAAQTAALNAIQNGRVPDAYRSLVRDYFQSNSDPIEESHRP